MKDIFSLLHRMGVESPGREADHSHPFSAAEVKNAYSYTSTPTCLCGVVLNYA